jgi:F-box/WD-40 domain protein MET30
MALRQSVEVPNESPRASRSNLRNTHDMTIEMPQEQRMEMARAEQLEAGEPPSHENCDSQHDASDGRIALSSKSKLFDQTVAPFLAKHIPDQYAPLGVRPQITATSSKDPNKKDPNTKYCYRHRPDSKCRRTADEPTMENLQRVRRIGPILWTNVDMV